MRVLFFMSSIADGTRHFEPLLRALLERGHEVQVLLDVERKGPAGDPALFDGLAADWPAFSWRYVPTRADSDWERFARSLRLSIDYLHFLEPRFRDAPALRARSGRRAPPLFQRLCASRLSGTAARRRGLDRLLRLIEARLPPHQEVQRLIEQEEPDLVLVSPLVDLGSPQGDYLRAAREVGIPSALLVASWDNLTNKGVIRDRPDRTIVWNEAQAAEAVEIHGLESRSIAAVGAHSYDRWFRMRPSTTAAEFGGRVGLGPEPFLLYVCSSGFTAPNEERFVEDWLRALRGSHDPRLRDIGVLIRPYPTAPAEQWRALPLDELGPTVIWPQEDGLPADSRRQADYFDSVHHSCAVIGINTSALIESSILERPVFTVLAPEFRRGQEGMLHFSHLTGEGQGLLTTAASLDEHLAQLSVALEDPESGRERARRFVASFVRPRGLQRPAAAEAAAELEQLAGTGPSWPPEFRGALMRACAGPLVRAGPTLQRVVEPLGLRIRPPRNSAHADAGGKRILFMLEQPGLLSHFDDTIKELTRRRHEVVLALSRPHKWPEALETLEDEVDSGRVSVRPSTPKRKDRWTEPAAVIRSSADYIQYLQPGLEQAVYCRERWRRLARLPPLLRRLQDRDRLGRLSARLLLSFLAAAEDAIPGAVKVERFLEKLDPDVLVVSPLIMRNTYQADYVKAARALGIPSTLAVASWDNLTTKGRIRVPPDRVAVWNDTQRTEAVEIHGVPEARVSLTGAPSFDRWFGRRPASERAEFLARFSLSPDRPLVLFVGCRQLGGQDLAEEEFVRRWVDAIRSSADPALREASVLVRPHPSNTTMWADEDLADVEGASVWRREHDRLPVRERARDAYYDAFHHSAAVVGVNSSALLEAAIVGRPVHVVALPELRHQQGDWIHFNYILPENGGFVEASRTLDEHLERLSEDLRRGPDASDRHRHFLATFIRPVGGERSASSALASAIEDAANGAPCRRRTSPVVLALLRAALLTRVMPGFIADAGRALARRSVNKGKALQRAGAHFK